ncbi:MAG: type II toxin-antitoxin system RelE/ParE family toxin [Gallionella sp.]|jgi:plasmid stabilization system protein ParE
MYHIVFRRQARREFDDAGDWYEKERTGLGLEFFAAIEHLLKLIADKPEQFPVLFRDTRKAVVKRFPYCIYFRLKHQHVVVLAVFHSSRNPSIWQSRIM